MTTEDRLLLTCGRKIIVKLGSMVLAAPGGGIDHNLIDRLAQEMADLSRQGRVFVIVSSGAILMGMQEMGRRQRPRTVQEKQALAAIGQNRLMRAYMESFSRHGIKVGQVLLTREGLDNRARFVMARNTLETLLHMGVIPVINENDTVAVDEIRFGDNDFLASMVVNLADADLLILLTNTRGLFSRDPRLGEGKLVEVVEDVDETVLGMAGGAGVAGTGGMSSKVLAAKRVAHMGVPTVIADGRTPGAIKSILQGEPVGTLFLPSPEKLASRKHWIAYSANPKGTLVIDDGAVKALTVGKKSLLPSGILEVKGRFENGALVRCVNREGREIARGVTEFSSGQIRMVRGRHSKDIELILGSCPGEEIIHRDDLVILEGKDSRSFIPDPGF
ncbi:MAG: glutamate 5-kinase [Proteobacteria bacterium]|nr:glutamate 5-kinase [Pseudomonadota bacterium]